MFRAILACLLLQSAAAFGGLVGIARAPEANLSDVPTAAEWKVARWLFEDDLAPTRANALFDLETPEQWRLTERAVSPLLSPTIARIDARDQQPVAVPLPPAVIGGGVVAMLAGSLRMLRRRRPIARTFR